MRWRLGMVASVAAVAAVASVLLGAAHAAGAQPRDTGKPAVASPAPASAAAGEGREVAVTVYNENLGVVKDRRRFSISSGLSELRFADVASLIEPTSVHLRSLGKSPLEILWQDYRFDLVSTDKLLERYVDQPIEVSTKDDQVKRGTLLSYDPVSLVIQETGGGLSLLNRAEVRQVGLKEVPKGLITRPTLVWRLRSGAGGDQPLEVSYMTGGMGWHAEYVAVVDDAGSSLDLQGWASVENRSGATFDDAKIKLVAGSIHRAGPERPPQPLFERGVAVDMMAKMEERGFFEYHLYEVPLRAALANNEVKQLGLLQASGIKSTKKYTYDAQKDPKQVMVTVEFENEAASGLGMPLPAGIVRVFQRDKDESLELAGEDRIDHTPKNETVRVSVGGAFDITAERKQTDMKQVTPRIAETAFSITLKNHKAEAAEVTVVEHAYGDWEIVESTLPAKKKDATTFEFVARCAPEKPFTITYRLRTRS
ncbi:MAG: DUF4139 domain-containing protein [Candidatus Eisenbacteria bacterium]|uniref:DUF4139 domain-containing protein n=1 Tax=Eiseniibacteriota bacterium TaxID=2212470 RepID=A0A538TPQ7_UNCEI|nr:MAG: DUF4139 domain-containing protein [Candidatus Eisenbacteria bacterium]